MQREGTNYKSNDLHGLNGVQVTSSTPKVTPRSQLAFENLFTQSSATHAKNAQPRSSRDLVVQMYTHIKTLRKLEQEREIRLSKAERRRQAKQESSSFILRPGRFNRKWHSDRSNPMRSPSPNNDADTDANTDSNNNLAERGGSPTPDEVFQSGSSGDETFVTENSISTTKCDMNPVTTGSDSEMISNRTEKSNAFSNRNIEDGDEEQPPHPSLVGGDVSSSGREMKRPEPYKIQFHQTASAESMAERKGIKFHWDSVKAGSVVPAPVSVVTFDGSLFT